MTESRPCDDTDDVWNAFLLRCVEPPEEGQKGEGVLACRTSGFVLAPATRARWIARAAHRRAQKFRPNAAAQQGRRRRRAVECAFAATRQGPPYRPFKKPRRTCGETASGAAPRRRVRVRGLAPHGGHDAARGLAAHLCCPRLPWEQKMILTQCAVCATELGLSLGKKCGRCSTRYCGAACQVQHWKEGGHDQLCRKIKKAGGAEQYNANKKYTEARGGRGGGVRRGHEGADVLHLHASSPSEHEGGPRARCACRGTAGFAHVSCLAEQAKILVAEVEENNLDEGKV